MRPVRRVVVQGARVQLQGPMGTPDGARVPGFESRLCSGDGGLVYQVSAAPQGPPARARVLFVLVFENFKL